MRRLEFPSDGREEKEEDCSGQLQLPSASEAWLLTSGQGDHQSLRVDPFLAQGPALYQPGGTPPVEHHHDKTLISPYMMSIALHSHCPPLALYVQLWPWFSCLSFPLVDDLLTEAEDLLTEAEDLLTEAEEHPVPGLPRLSFPETRGYSTPLDRMMIPS